MKTITIEDAQDHFDQYLAQVEAGETFIITVDDVPIARFTPPTDCEMEIAANGAYHGDFAE